MIASRPASRPQFLGRVYLSEFGRRGWSKSNFPMALSPLGSLFLLLAATSVACLHVESVRSLDHGRAGHAAARCAGDGPRSGPGALFGFGRRLTSATTLALRGGSEGEGEVNEVPRDDFASPPIGTPPLEDDRKVNSPPRGTHPHFSGACPFPEKGEICCKGAAGAKGRGAASARMQPWSMSGISRPG